MAYTNSRYGKPDISMSCNGMLAGLVAITAPCAFVAPWAAAVIGIVAGFLVCYGVWFFDHVAHVDDPCGAISVHGVCGAWGVLAVGLFADGTYGGGWNGVGGHGEGAVLRRRRPAGRSGLRRRGRLRLGIRDDWVIITVAKRFMRIRVAREEAEIVGLDEPEFGSVCYPDFVLATTSSAGLGHHQAEPVADSEQRTPVTT